MKFLTIIIFLFFSHNLFSQLGKDIDYIRKVEKKEFISKQSDKNSTRFNFRSSSKNLNGTCDEIIIYHINNNTALCEMISYASCSSSANNYAKAINEIAVKIESNKWKDYTNNSIYTLKVDGNIAMVEHFKEYKNELKDVKLIEGAKLLFLNSKSSLSASDMNKIYLESGFYLTRNKLFFVLDYDDSDENSFSAYLEFIDLNNDNIKDVSISYGNIYTSGMTGSNVALFIKKNINENYLKSFDIIALELKVLDKRTNGYNDIMPLGRGYYNPVWKWDGLTYKFSHKINQ